MTVLIILLAGVIGYLCGSVPFGFLYVKLVKGVNLTEIGSGRTGGTNSLRAAGAPVGVLTAFSDIFKGALAVLLVRWLFGSTLAPTVLPWAEIAAGIFAVVGHNWSLFLRFRGGAGTGPNVGWGMVIWWPMLPIGFTLMVGLLLTIGMASVASMSIAFVIPITFLVLYLLGISPYDSTFAYVVGGVITAVIVIWALRPNIKRLLNGTERVVGPRARRMKKQKSAK
ncbi:MAG: glycerol-3-phosphate acyltransferase [Anaerolineales bacterium]|nr:glycerol-3-phosphate acyltransferase [Anaerolineales bacterium]